MSRQRRLQSVTNIDTATTSGRIGWLVRERFKGNRTLMAEAIGFSHTLVARVVNGENPSRKLLEAIATRLRVDLAWLVNGVGDPFSPEGPGRLDAMPVTKNLLRGAPLKNQEWITGDWVSVPEVVASPSRYWLMLTSSDPLVRANLGFRRGDYLLMETDRGLFPRIEGLFERLCVVRDVAKGGALRLATVTYSPASIEDGPEYLEADYHELGDAETEGVEHVYRHGPSGEVQYSRRPVEASPRGRQPRNAPALASEPILPRLAHADIVGVWLLIIRRAGA